MIKYDTLVNVRKKMYAIAYSYTKYIVPFILLQLFGKLLSDHRVTVTDFGKVEIICLVALDIVFWMAYLILRFVCYITNREVKYNQILREYYIDKSIQPYTIYGPAWGKYLSVMTHPDIIAGNSQERKVWGWGDDGVLEFECDGVMKSTDLISLVEKPWTSSEQKIVTVRVQKQNIGSPKLDEERLKTFIGRGNVNFSNTVYVCSHLITENGEILFDAGEEDIRPLTIDMMEKCEVTGGSGQEATYALRTRFFQRLLQTLIEQGSIILSGDCKIEDAIVHAGILSMALEYDNSNENQEEGNTRIILPVYIEVNDKVLLAEDAKMQKISGEGNTDTYFGYARLLYEYAIRDRYSFAEKLIRESRRKEKSGELSKKDKKDRTENKKADHNTEKAKTGILELRYYIYKWLTDDTIAKVLVLLAAYLENILEPIATADDVTITSLGSVIEAIKAAQLAESFWLITVLFILVLVTKLSTLSHQVRCFFNPSIVLLEKLKEKDTTEENMLLKIGSNINLCWPENPAEGWSRDEFKINISNQKYALSEQWKPFLTEKLRNEKNDGVKFRMVSFQNNEEGIYILLDQCRYTQTMCVQEYLKALRNGNTKDDALKQEAENAVLNLKMRKEAIDLEKIPPNSFCLHAVVLTKDGYILRTRRDKKLAYYAEQYDFSIEEQLNISDIGKEGIRISTWAERMCKEELGIENRNAEGNAIQNVQVASVFYEQDAVNVAISATITLGVTMEKLRSIMRDWPREDYEFQYDFCTWKDIERELIRPGNVPMEQETEGAIRSYRYHPTAINRMFWTACLEKRFRIARLISEGYDFQYN